LVIHKTEVGLGDDVFLFCHPSIPLLHPGVVLRGLALVIRKTEVGLGGGVFRFCHPSIPLRRLGVVLRNTVAFVIHEAEDKLGDGVSLLSLRLNELICCLVVTTPVCFCSVLDRTREYRTSHQEGGVRRQSGSMRR
jgi:hypothetical protein